MLTEDEVIVEETGELKPGEKRIVTVSIPSIVRICKINVNKIAKGNYVMSVLFWQSIIPVILLAYEG